MKVNYPSIPSSSSYSALPSSDILLPRYKKVKLFVKLIYSFKYLIIIFGNYIIGAK